MTPTKGTPSRKFRVATELWEAAQRVARRRGETVSDVIRRALERYVKHNGDDTENDQPAKEPLA